MSEGLSGKIAAPTFGESTLKGVLKALEIVLRNVEEIHRVKEKMVLWVFQNLLQISMSQGSCCSSRRKYRCSIHKKMFDTFTELSEEAQIELYIITMIFPITHETWTADQGVE